MVEPQPSKLVVRVRSPSSALEKWLVRVRAGRIETDSQFRVRRATFVQQR